MATITIMPTMTLSKADAWAAAFAPEEDREPMKLPTRVDAATPIPKGRVFKTSINWLNHGKDGRLSGLTLISCHNDGLRCERNCSETSSSQRYDLESSPVPQKF